MVTSRSSVSAINPTTGAPITVSEAAERALAEPPDLETERELPLERDEPDERLLLPLERDDPDEREPLLDRALSGLRRVMRTHCKACKTFPQESIQSLLPSRSPDRPTRVPTERVGPVTGPRSSVHSV